MRPVPARLQALRDRTATDPAAVTALVEAERAHTDSYKETTE